MKILTLGLGVTHDLRVRRLFVQMLDDVLVGVDTGIELVIILVHAAKSNPGLELSGGMATT